MSRLHLELALTYSIIRLAMTIAYQVVFPEGTGNLGSPMTVRWTF